jgi:hypothetical protein
MIFTTPKPNSDLTSYQFFPHQYVYLLFFPTLSKMCKNHNKLYNKEKFFLTLGTLLVTFWSLVGKSGELYKDA